MNISLDDTRAKQAASFHYVLQLFCRYFIAFMMFAYSAAKLFGTQFTAEPYQLDVPVGQLRGFELAWIFFGYSHPYGWVIAFSQIAAGALLLFRPTLRLGLLLFLAIMGNILMLNFFYGIGTGGLQDPKYMAMLLLAMALYLFLWDWRAFAQYIFGTPYTANSAVPAFAKKFHAAKYVVIPILFLAAFGGIYALKQTFMPTSPLVGSWDVDEGSEVSRLYFNSGGFCTALTAGERVFGDCYLDEATGKIHLTLGEGTTHPFTFDGSYTREGDTLTLTSATGETIALHKVQYPYGNPNYR
jgi:hypothetical protein